MNKLTLGSLFSGSGGFELGGILCGIEPLWASEIEPFPIRVTTKRIPQMKHFGDISKLNGAQLPPVDIITFGSPCTDMSVAGKRAGLDGEQSVLFYEAIRIVKEMRCKTNGQYPRFIVWENVPGAFSSNKGEDFRAVLESITGIKDKTISIPKPNKWLSAGEIVGEDYSIAWRTIDAQYWGVPQRRKRIYLVADFTGRSAGKILFKSEGLSRDSSQSIKPWEGTTTNIKGGTGETGTTCLNDQGGNRMDVTEDMTSTLRAKSNHPPLVFENHSQDSRYVGPLETAQTVLATFGTGGNNQPFVMETPKTLKIRCGCEGGGKGALIQDNKSATISCNNDQTLFVPTAFGICAKDSNSMKSDNPYSGIYEADTSRTVDCNGGNPSCNQGGIAVVALQGSMIGRKDCNGPQGDGLSEDISFTLNTVDKHAVIYAIDRESFNCGQNFARNLGINDEGISSTLNAQGPSAVATPTYSSSKASFFTSAETELANTLVATDYKDPPLINAVKTASGKEVFGTIAASMGSKQWLGNQEAFSGDYHIVEPEYIVRRLTPTECARLQGFPDWWCSDLETKDPTEEDIAFWMDVFETHRRIIGKAKKPKSRKQIIKWLQHPHSDSAEYKMWGNGVALPCVCFVLAGIVELNS
ncbi:DNA (cytosine-5-)-methyltransferase [Anaerocolumna sedimenticola]|uniref:DNA (cytosine-5-)-methyltransferase n=1 Tax=Anaerocolumna sedimenticola TaxID=2696063 RepID=A0A6P1TQP0_9FIRM|nr:DNA cytosine methyltransferase [Anaerocolumna sedimenticola]QHQ62667.1 DNA (cytosine-5-)-methyltransferase [Anaerocolumna sedimenticola]